MTPRAFPPDRRPVLARLGSRRASLATRVAPARRTGAPAPRGRRPTKPATGWLPVAGGFALASVLALLAPAHGSASSALPPAAPPLLLAPLSPRLVVPGTPPGFLWPARGEAAVAVAGVGLVGASPDERQVPIASLTKMMTALVVLADHPLLPGESGPSVTLSATDVQDYQQEVLAGDSTVKVSAGEVLSEYQLLEAMLMPSGDNIADRLAVWDAGSIAAFVDKMNAAAARLGLGSTHYADASGVDPRSSSTAVDQAFLASKLIADPLVRTIVRRRRVAFPVTGTIPNPNPALGVDGIIGVKGGYTSEARNCLVTAAFRGHHRVLVVSVALGQPSRTAPASIDESLLETATAKLERLPLADPAVALVRASATALGGRDELFARAAGGPVTVWPGLVLAANLDARADPSSPREAAYGALAGVVTLSAPWGPLGSVALERAAAPAPAAAAAAASAAALAAAALSRGHG